MIQTFKDADSREVFEKGRNRRWANIQNVAKRKLIQLESATRLSDLVIPSSNRLELLKGDRKGRHSIRINDQYRICFLWKTDGAYEVEITDYH
jgi:proteic killer suppression protein